MTVKCTNNFERGSFRFVSILFHIRQCVFKVLGVGGRYACVFVFMWMSAYMCMSVGGGEWEGALVRE